MKKGLCVILVFILAQANAQKTIVKDNNAQIRKVGNYTAIHVSSAISLYLNQSESNDVAVSAKDDETRAQIVTEVVDGVLIIKMSDRSGWWSWKSWGDIKAKAYVSIKDINSITGSGATNIHLLNKIQSPKMKIKLSGASDLKGEVEAGAISINLSGASNYKGQLKASSLLLDASGASEIELAGSVDDLSVELSGASDAKLFNLNAKGAIVHASGASDANVNVSQLLKVQASGASNINYKGNPVIKEKSSSGASDIHHRD
jgi:hypothetical protein